MPVVLRGRFAPLDLEYEVQGTSPLGAVTEWTALIQELEKTGPEMFSRAEEKPSQKAARDFKIVPAPQTAPETIKEADSGPKTVAAVVEPKPKETKAEKRSNPPLPKADPAERAPEKPKEPAKPKKAPSVPMSKNGAVCCECQTPLSASEERTSRLFVSRPLCKKCLQAI